MKTSRLIFIGFFSLSTMFLMGAQDSCGNEIVEESGDKNKKTDNMGSNESNSSDGEKLSALTAKNGLCEIKSSDKSAFEIFCPHSIKTIRYEFISSGKSLKINTNINGKMVNLYAAKFGNQTIKGRTTNSNIAIELELENGDVEIIQIN